MTGPGPAAGLVHGMGKELVEPDWAPLTGDEVGAVLARYGLPAGHDLAASGTGPGAGPRTGAVVAWSSPRPMSAAGLVGHGTGTVFVKRHHVRVRSAAQLAAEHAFATHLRASGLPVPAVWRTPAGRTVVERRRLRVRGARGGAGHRPVPGRDVVDPVPEHRPCPRRGCRARPAAPGGGRVPRAARSPAVLTSSCDVITAADPLAAVDAIARRRPGLARYLAGRDWRGDLARDHLPVIRRAAPLLGALEPQWGHGDWHPSNLTWDSAGPDARGCGGVRLRAGQPHLRRARPGNRAGTQHHRLARSGRDGRRPGWTPAAWTRCSTATQAVRPLSPAEARALPEVLPVVHLEYALSEVEYFADVVASPGLADLAYDAYLIGHTRWFADPDGAAMLDRLRRREPVS